MACTPLAAVTSASSGGRSLAPPQALTRQRTSPGVAGTSGALSSPSTASAPATRAPQHGTSAARTGSRMAGRLPRSTTDAPGTVRAAPGGSTFTTSAPSAASRNPAYEAASPDARSTTRRSARGASPAMAAEEPPPWGSLVNARAAIRPRARTRSVDLAPRPPAEPGKALAERHLRSDEGDDAGEQHPGPRSRARVAEQPEVHEHGQDQDQSAYDLPGHVHGPPPLRGNSASRGRIGRFACGLEPSSVPVAVVLVPAVVVAVGSVAVRVVRRGEVDGRPVVDGGGVDDRQPDGLLDEEPEAREPDGEREVRVGGHRPGEGHRSERDGKQELLHGARQHGSRGS